MGSPLHGAGCSRLSNPGSGLGCVGAGCSKRSALRRCSGGRRTNGKIELSGLKTWYRTFNMHNKNMHRQHLEQNRNTYTIFPLQHADILQRATKKQDIGCNGSSITYITAMKCCRELTQALYL